MHVPFGRFSIQVPKRLPPKNVADRPSQKPTFSSFDEFGQDEVVGTDSPRHAERLRGKIAQAHAYLQLLILSLDICPHLLRSRLDGAAWNV